MNNLMKTLAVSLGFFIPISTFMTNIILALLLILSSRWSNIKRLPEWWKAFPVLKRVALLLGIMALGGLYSIADSQEVMYSLKKSAKLLAVFILLPLFFEKEWRIRAYWAFLAAVGLTVLFATLDYHGWYHFPKDLFHVKPGRPDVFKDSLYTAFIVAMGTFVAAQLIQEYRSRLKWVIALGVFIALSTYSMLWVSSGRTGQLIFMGLWCLFCYSAWRIRGLCWGAIGLCVVLSLAWATPTSRFSELWLEVFDALQPKIQRLISKPVTHAVVLETTEQAREDEEPTLKTIEPHAYPLKRGRPQTPEQGSTGIRLSIWREGLRMIQEKPWFGWGTGSFQILAAKLESERPGAVDLSVAKNPHNQYLNVGVQQGIIGLLALLFLFWGLFKDSRQLPRIESGVLQGILMAMVVGCFGNSWLTDFTSGYLFIWLVSITIAAGSQNKIIRGEGHVSCI